MSKEKDLLRLVALHSKLRHYCDEVARVHKSRGRDYYGLASWSQQELAERDKIRGQISDHRRTHDLTDDDDRRAADLAAEVHARKHIEQDAANEDGNS